MLIAKLIAALLLIASIAQPEPAAAPKPASKPQQDLKLPKGVVATRDVVYAEVGDKKLLLDIYGPEAEGASLRPVVIWIHGGGWQGGSKDDCPGVFLVEKGYSVVSISYRLTGVAPFPAQIHDCKAAVRWVRAHAKEHGIDADRIGVWGASAGGHLSALLGTSDGVKEMDGDVGENDEQSSRVHAVCDWFGPTDIEKLCADFVAKENAKNKTSNETTPPIFKRLLGGEIKDKMELCKSANPIKYVDKTDAPTLIMHGDKDELVPLSQSEKLLEALKKVGVPVELEVVKGAGHGFWNPTIADQIAAFFDKHLKKAE